MTKQERIDQLEGIIRQASEDLRTACSDINEVVGTDAARLRSCALYIGAALGALQVADAG